MEDVAEQGGQGRAGTTTMMMMTKTCSMILRILDTNRDCTTLDLMIPT